MTTHVCMKSVHTRARVSPCVQWTPEQAARAWVWLFLVMMTSPRLRSSTKCFLLQSILPERSCRSRTHILHTHC